jgi:hypothetical protein
LVDFGCFMNRVIIWLCFDTLCGLSAIVVASSGSPLLAPQ